MSDFKTAKITFEEIKNFTARAIGSAKIFFENRCINEGDGDFRLEITSKSKFLNEAGETVIIGDVIADKEYRTFMEGDTIVFQVRETVVHEIDDLEELKSFLQKNVPDLFKGKTWDNPPTILSRDNPESSDSKPSLKMGCGANIPLSKLTKSQPIIAIAIKDILAQIRLLSKKYKDANVDPLVCGFQNGENGCLKLFCHKRHADQDNHHLVIKAAQAFESSQTWGNLFHVLDALYKTGRLSFGMYEKVLYHDREELVAVLSEKVPLDIKSDGFKEYSEKVTAYLTKLLVVGCMETEFDYPRLFTMCPYVNCRKDECTKEVHWFDEEGENSYPLFGRRNPLPSEKELILYFRRKNFESHCTLTPFIL